MRRWLLKGSVLINGKRVQPNDIVEYPIGQLVFFYDSKRPCTLFDDDKYYENNPELCRMRDRANKMLIEKFDEVLKRIHRPEMHDI